jgi:predicted phage baseplate assembly protein
MNLEVVSKNDTKTVIITPDGDPQIKKGDEVDDTIYLDNSYERILPDSWIVVETQNTDMTCLRSLVSKARNPQNKKSRSAYGISGRTTIIELDYNWLNETQQYDFKAIRTTVVYAQSEELKLAEEPIMDDVEKEKIELDTLYPGLDSGRWIIVSGERTIPNTSGVKASELVMLARVEQSSDEDQSGEKGTTGVHSTLILDKGLAYTYKRETVTIYANVVKATHGEIKKEVLGSGDGSAAFQQFDLRQAPLTYLSAATPQGAKSSLQVRVNGILWHEAESLLDLGPRDRGYITKTDDAGKTAVIFGNGEHGSRLPTGMENVTAVYRAGIGRPGNVLAGQIRLLATKPPGAKAVANPLRSSGGADREGPDQGRRNAPLAAMALDRLVSVEDYAFFARTYAGIEKASAVSLSNGHRQLVHLTIAGSDDIPIDTTSDLLRNLNQALHQFGDPFQPVKIDVRELMLLVISANVRILPDYQWEKVEPQIRSALLDAFGFDRRELGQSAFLSEAVSEIQQVEGVDYVDMVVFDSVLENVKPEDLANLSSSLSLKPTIEVQLAGPNKKLEKPDQDKRILPAQLAYLSPDMRDTLILNPLEVSV